MSGVIEQPRHLCMLSAKQSVVAIERAVPIVHAGPGCSGKLWSGLSFCNGFQGSGYAGGGAVPSTNTGEKEVVFGGEERLRGVIEGALKVMDADLFVVLTGCTSDIVGDDTGQVVREFREQGIPIVYAETGGFKGSSFVGHEALLEAVITQLLDPAAPEKAPNLVNVFASVPYLDPFWSGNLEALRELLAGLGLEANILFGPGSGGIEAWRKIPAARFNLVVSPWVGLKAARFLEERYGTPFLHYPVLPIGGTETSRFLATVGEFADVDRGKRAAFIRKEEERFYYYLERSADFILEFRYDLPGRFITVCDALYALGVSRFLVNDLGLLPGRQFITDQTPTEHRESLRAEFAALSPSVAAQVTFTPDGGEVQRELRATKHHQPPLIIGSTWDKDIAAELKGYQVSLSLPVTDRLVLDRSYVGYRGGLRLAEDIYAAILGSYQ
jgi:nitrogenase molybdenum-iron protein beta chain